MPRSTATRACGARTRSGAPCAIAPVRGRRRCRIHGGLSTGPRTAQGRARAFANLIPWPSSRENPRRPAVAPRALERARELVRARRERNAGADPHAYALERTPALERVLGRRPVRARTPEELCKAGVIER